MSSLTTIRLQISTREELKSRGKKNEKYDDILQRLLALTMKPTFHSTLKAQAVLFLKNLGCKQIEAEYKFEGELAGHGPRIDVLGYKNKKSIGVECSTKPSLKVIRDTRKRFLEKVSTLYLCYKAGDEVIFKNLKIKHKKVK